MSSLYNGVLQKGYLQGHEAGIKEGKVEMILSLIKHGFSLNDAFNFFDLDDSIKQEVLKKLDTKE